MAPAQAIVEAQAGARAGAHKTREVEQRSCQGTRKHAEAEQLEIIQVDKKQQDKIADYHPKSWADVPRKIEEKEDYMEHCQAVKRLQNVESEASFSTCKEILSI